MIKGIVRQGRHAMYRNQQQYHRGHLTPVRTLSESQERYDSTYTYTNCVPLHPAFNSGMWRQFEERIRVYAEHTCTQPRGQGGTLYLLTGTSLVRIQQQQNNREAMDQVPVNQLPNPSIPDLAITIPNSLWTAGCCVRPNDQNTQSFAVIGNNAQIQNERLTVQVTVTQLQNILAYDVSHQNIGRQNINLFPGNDACSNSNNNINLPPARRRGLE